MANMTLDDYLHTQGIGRTQEGEYYYIENYGGVPRSVLDQFKQQWDSGAVNPSDFYYSEGGQGWVTPENINSQGAWMDYMQQNGWQQASLGQDVLDYFRQTGQGNFPNNEAYLDYLFGQGNWDSSSNFGKTMYRSKNYQPGMDFNRQFQNTPLQYNPKDFSDYGWVLPLAVVGGGAAIDALGAGAGAGGALGETTALGTLGETAYEGTALTDAIMSAAGEGASAAQIEAATAAVTDALGGGASMEAAITAGRAAASGITGEGATGALEGAGMDYDVTDLGDLTGGEGNNVVDLSGGEGNSVMTDDWNAATDNLWWDPETGYPVPEGTSGAISLNTMLDKSGLGDLAKQQVKKLLNKFINGGGQGISDSIFGGALSRMSPLDLALLLGGMYESYQQGKEPTTQETKYADWYSTAAQNLLGKAGALTPTESYKPYVERAGALTERGATPLSEIDLTPYMNPYIDSILDPMRRRHETDLSKTLNTINSNAAMSNAFGRNRNLLEAKYATESADRAWNELESNVRKGAFDTALTTAGGDLTRATTAGGQMLDIGKALPGMETEDLTRGVLTESNVLKNVTPDKTVTTTNPPPSLFAQGAGALATYAGLDDAFKE